MVPGPRYALGWPDAMGCNPTQEPPGTMVGRVNGSASRETKQGIWVTFPLPDDTKGAGRAGWQSMRPADHRCVRVVRSYHSQFSPYVRMLPWRSESRWVARGNCRLSGPGDYLGLTLRGNASATMSRAEGGLHGCQQQACFLPSRKTRSGGYISHQPTTPEGIPDSFWSEGRVTRVPDLLQSGEELGLV